MEDKPLFSVLIANYNNSRYLQEAIDSVLAQTYTNWEIILVDDGSTDNSFSIYEQYNNDRRFYIYYNEENRGCGFTKRKCVELASGELCGFLDPDDKLARNAIEIMVNAHASRTKCSLVYSTFFIWDGKDGNLPVSELVGAMENGEDFLISSRNNVSHFAVFKKHYYDMTSGIDITLSSAEDVDDYFKLEEVGDLCYVPLPLYYYRQNNPNSLTIANEMAKNKAFHNRMIASLNAFSRRIKTRNPLFKVNEDKYLQRMRWQMGTYKRGVGKVDRRLVVYCWWYWVGNRFTIKSLSHVFKLFVK